jgi:hypothetical protein
MTRTEHLPFLFYNIYPLKIKTGADTIFKITVRYFGDITEAFPDNPQNERI